MSDIKKIKTALVSVFHKDGLDDILYMLHAQGVKFLSTGGTKTFIEGLGYPCQAVEDLTSYPSILGGRVKLYTPKYSAESSDVVTTLLTRSRWQNMRFLKLTS